MSHFRCNHDGSCDTLRICCTDTEMTLTSEDISRIEKLGFDPSDFLNVAEDGFAELKNVNGLCFFYDDGDSSCRIYSDRPEGCRHYPIVYDMSQGKCVVDSDCPSANTVTKSDIEAVCKDVKNLVERLVREAKNAQ